MGTNQALNELIADAKMPDNEIAVRNLLEQMEKIDIQDLRDAAPAFGELCGSWEEGVTKSDDMANICVRLAELSILDSEPFRASLHAAIRKLLPPYLAGGSVVKAIGAKDTAVNVRDVAQRLRKLQHLRSTALVYQLESHTWGAIHGIDRVTGTIGITSPTGGSVSSVPIASAITALHFFDTTPDMMTLLYPGKTSHRPAAEYRRVFAKCSLSEISEQKIRDIVLRLMVPEIMASDAFDAWWKAETHTGSKRPFWEARSVLELYTLLQQSAEAGKIQVSSAAAEKLAGLFTHLRADMLPKDVAMLTSCISALADSGTPEVLTSIFRPLLGKCSFWPSPVTADIPLTKLEPWGKISAKDLTGFVKIAALLYSPEELAELGSLLPLKCIGPVFAAIPGNIVQTMLLAKKHFTCDQVLWIYRNRANLPEKLVSDMDLAKVISALSGENLPREWAGALRDLRKAIFDKPDFQKYILENADGDVPSVVSALQKYRNFQPGERQSILVKLSRHSADLKAYLESGAGLKLMGVEATKPAEIPVTSLASRKHMTDELEDIITNQIPENAAAVALARSFGDLRENAEYDAAKERRRFLHRRRADLERMLESVQGTDFKGIEAKEHAVVGSVVTLAAADGKKIDYYLLGAFDGNPEKHFVSYKTKIGEAILDKKIGDTVTIPEVGTFTVAAVGNLPESLRKELANEK